MSSQMTIKANPYDASRVALAASLQALFVFASRAGAASLAESTNGRVATLAGVLPSCLSAAMSSAGDPASLLDCLEIPRAAAFLDRGWASAVGKSPDRLKAPGRLAVRAWHCAQRLTPMISALQREHADSPSGGAHFAHSDVNVHPIGHPDGVRAEPMSLADEMQRTEGYPSAWERLVDGAQKLPHLETLGELTPWLWHFDSFLKEFLHGIPAYWEGLADTSFGRLDARDALYDQCRIAGAIAHSLYRHAASGHSGPPLLLIGGEMNSIQEYILGPQSTSGVDVAELMRGRSSFLRLVVEVAAYRVCEELQLLPGSVVVSAASKFTLLAPNLPECHGAVRSLQILFDQWALNMLSGQTALSMAMTPCLESDLATTGRQESQCKEKPGVTGGLPAVMAQLARRAQDSRLHRYSLCAGSASTADDAPHWIPPIYLETDATGTVADFQAHLARVLVTDNPRAILHPSRPSLADSRAQSMPILGFEVAITSRKPVKTQGAAPMQWDLRSWSSSAHLSTWRGYCRKPLAVYAADTTKRPAAPQARMRQVMKGDVDNLSTAFQQWMPSPNLSRIAMLSRDLEEFFSIRVPEHLARQFPDLVTILSGGDDFIFLGAHMDIMEFGLCLQSTFASYGQSKLTLSAGTSLPFADGWSIRGALDEADDALALAKKSRNSMGFAGIAWSWSEWEVLLARVSALRSLIDRKILSRQAVVTIAELLNGARNSPYVWLKIEDELRAQAARIPENSVDACLEVGISRIDAFRELKKQLLVRTENNDCERALVPLTLAYGISS